MEILKKSTLDVSSPTNCTVPPNKYDSMDDFQLWTKFINNDEGAFIKIYNDHFKELSDFGLQFAPMDMVEDAIQDLFIDLRRKRDKLSKIKRSIRAFLFQCLKRRLFNMLKSQKGNTKMTVPEHRFGILPSHESIIILNEEQKAKSEKLDRILAELNEKHREALYYYFYKGMSYEEVRDMLGFQDVKSARNLIYKIVKTLRKSFLAFF